MSAFSLIDRATPELLGWLHEHGQAQRLSAPTTLIREGDQIEALVLLLSGELSVYTSVGDSLSEPLAVLSAGSLVGEMSWLEQRPTVASVTASSDSLVLEVPFDQLDQLQREQPLLATELQRLIACKLALQIQSQNAWIHRFNTSQQEPLRKVLVLFAALNEQDVDWLRQMGRLQRLADGAVLIEAGEPVPALYLVLAGEARILVRSNCGIREVGTSRRGELLGEMSLLTPGLGVASATVVSHGGMELLRLDQAELLSALDAAPLRAMRFWYALARMLSQRSRDQLLERGLAKASRIAEQQGADDELDLTQLAAISTAGSRFDWLCRQFQNQEG